MGNEIFQEALANFMHDVASGDAIRHLANQGYTVPQIMKRLDFPTAKDRVERIFTTHLIREGILFPTLPDGTKKLELSGEGFFGLLKLHDPARLLLECPFASKKQTDLLLPLLTVDEAEYLASIRWDHFPMYHILNPRMCRIAEKMQFDALWRMES